MVLAGEQSPAIWDEVFLDTASRTSHVLAKLVLDAMGVHPRFTPMHADEGLARAKGTKGALVIGDRGFERAREPRARPRPRVDPPHRPADDLRAVGGAPGRVSPEDVQELTRAAQHGLGIRTELAQRFAAQKGGDPERYRRYLTQRIRYGLGPLRAAGARGVPPDARRRRASSRP